MDELRERPGHCWSLELVGVVIQLAPLAGPGGMEESQFSVWKVGRASMVTWMVSEQTLVVDLLTIHAHAALHSRSNLI